MGLFVFEGVSWDTEYFNGTKWKPISTYEEGEKVLQYEDNKLASLVYPSAYMHDDDEHSFYHCSARGVNIFQTEGIGVLVAGLDGTTQIMSLKSIYEDPNPNKVFHIAPYCDYSDGNIYSNEYIASHVVNVECCEGVYTENMLSMPLRCKLFMLYEILRISGEKAGTTFKYNTPVKENAEFVASLAALSGIRSYIRDLDDCSFEVSIVGRCYSPIMHSAITPGAKKNGKYWLQTSSRMLVLRNKGNVYIAVKMPKRRDNA